MADDAPTGSILDMLGHVEFRLHEIEEARRKLSKEMGELDSEAARLKKELVAIEKRRAELRGGVAISDHALVRWMERHHGLDLDVYRQEIASPTLRRAIISGVDGLKTAEGSFKIKEGVVTTFVSSKGDRG